MNEKIRVLIVDDSPLVRETIKAIISSDPAIEVVGFARDGKEGFEKVLALRPNVITMDLKMPIMSGLESIERIMEDIPTPIIVVSSMDIKVIVTALGIGAMDFVPITDDIDRIARDLVEKVKIAARVKPIRRINIKKAQGRLAARKAPKKEAERVIAVGISTGGPQALQVLFSKLPHGLAAGVLVVQHIAHGFINGLVEWLRDTSHLDMKVAKAGDIVHNGTVFFAPDKYNMSVDNDGKIVLCEDIAKRATHIPSIDVMMKSVAEIYGEDAIGVIMTGMGQDGVEGVRAIKTAGGATIAQDEGSSVIFGMNKLAITSGYIDKVVPLEGIADEIARMVRG